MCFDLLLLHSERAGKGWGASAKRSRLVTDENPSKQKNKENSMLLRQIFISNWKLILNYIHLVKSAVNARVKAVYFK